MPSGPTLFLPPGSLQRAVTLKATRKSRKKKVNGNPTTKCLPQCCHGTYSVTGLEAKPWQLKLPQMRLLENSAQTGGLKSEHQITQSTRHSINAALGWVLRTQTRFPSRVPRTDSRSWPATRGGGPGRERAGGPAGRGRRARRGKPPSHGQPPRPSARWPAPPGRFPGRAAGGGGHMGASARPGPESRPLRPLTLVTVLVAAPGPEAPAPAVPPSPGRAPAPAPAPAAPAAPLLPPAPPAALAALAARLLRSFFFFLSLLAKKLSRLRSSVSAMAAASSAWMGGAGGGRGPRGSELGVEAGSALTLPGAATPQPRGVAEACAAGRAAPPACWRAVVRPA